VPNQASLRDAIKLRSEAGVETPVYRHQAADAAKTIARHMSANGQRITILASISRRFILLMGPREAARFFLFHHKPALKRRSTVIRPLTRPMPSLGICLLTANELRICNFFHAASFC